MQSMHLQLYNKAHDKTLTQVSHGKTPGQFIQIDKNIMKIQFILLKYFKDAKRSLILKLVNDNVVNKVKSTSRIISIYSSKLKSS